MFRALFLAASLVAGAALAQTAPMTGASAATQVAQVAPQLLTFAGSQANLDSLVNSLTAGGPTTLSTTLSDGSTQVVTFTSSTSGLTPAQIAQTLEQARQQLISRGIAAPTAQQVAVTLVGGSLPTQNGAVQVTGIAPVATAAAGGTALSSPVSVETRPAAATNPNSVGNTSAAAGGNISNSPLPRGISDTPPPPNNPTTAPPAINAPQQPMNVPPGAVPSGPRGFK